MQLYFTLDIPDDNSVPKNLLPRVSARPSAPTPPPFRSPELPERAGTFCRNVVILGGSMFFSENACCYCQPLSSTLPVTLLFVHPLAEMLKFCFCD